MRHFTRSENGASLVMALVCVAVIGTIAASAMQLATQMNAQAKSDVESKTLLTFIQAVETVAGTNSACLGTGGGLDGLKFKAAGGGFGATNFDPATAGDATVGQEMSIGTHLPAQGGGRFVAKTGAVYGPLNLRIVKMSFRKANRVIGTNQYDGELLLQADIGAHSFAPRVIGNMSLVFAGAVPGSPASACTYDESAQIACESMGCKFNAGAPAGKQKCVCGFPQMSCPAGSYITGIDDSVSPPAKICGIFKADCSDPAYGGVGNGYFLSGFDDAGKPICQPVEGSVTGSTPVPSCSGGASKTVTAVPAGPGCFCAAGQTWDGTNCAAPSSGFQWGSSSNGMSYTQPASSCASLGGPVVGTACTTLGQGCFDTVNTCNTAPCMSTWSGKTCFIASLAAIGATIDPSLGSIIATSRACTGGAGPSFITTSGTSEGCVSGAVMCTSTTSGTCVAPFAGGTTVTAFCSGTVGSTQAAPGCASGFATCSPIYATQLTCTP